MAEPSEGLWYPQIGAGRKSRGTYLDLGQELLVGLFFNPWVLGSLAWEVLGKFVEVGLLEQGLFFRVRRHRSVILGCTEWPKIHAISPIGATRVVLLHASVDDRVTGCEARSSCSSLSRLPDGKRLHLLPETEKSGC